MGAIYFKGALIGADGIVQGGALLAVDGRIAGCGREAEVGCPPGAEVIDAGSGYIGPGYVDLHCHGGDGADFMDGTEQAFRTALAAHARHGTTSLCPTTTVASRAQILAALEVCARAVEEEGLGLWGGEAGGARVAGAHFYGPYFGRGAEGCHPKESLREPRPEEFRGYLEFAPAITCATVAPEVAGAEAFARACGERGIRVHAGHSNATFAQVEAALAWGVAHVDHLYCAMSDKSKLRRMEGAPAYPMRGGLLEAALYFDALSTELIADGRHLSAELMRLAYKIKGPERLALVTDCNRALDRPDGAYVFGPREGGTPFVRRDGVGLTPDLSGLASSCVGMDEVVRVFCRQVGAPLHEVVRMASLTPARIAGLEQVGSLQVGKRADVLVLDGELGVQQVFVGGRRLRG